MRFVLAINKDNYICCGRCGKVSNLTKDHYIPKCFGRDIDYNYVCIPLCIKGRDIVSPRWYKFLKDSDFKRLYKYLYTIYKNCSTNYLCDKLRGIINDKYMNYENKIDCS